MKGGIAEMGRGKIGVIRGRRKKVRGKDGRCEGRHGVGGKGNRKEGRVGGENEVVTGRKLGTKVSGKREEGRDLGKW